MLWTKFHNLCMPLPLSTWKLSKEFLDILKEPIAYTPAKGSYVGHVLSTYTDGDWVRDSDERHSATGYYVYIGDNLIS